MQPLALIIMLLAVALPPSQVSSSAHEKVGSSNAPFSEYIYFIFTDETRVLSRVASCAAQTAALLNPRSTINLISKGQLAIPDELLDRSYFPNIKTEIISFEDILKDTPQLLSWYRENVNQGRKNFMADLSDALRIALLATRGGAYLDTDMISLKSLSSIPMNSLGKQMATADKKGKVPLLNGAALLFEKNHPFIIECINKFNESYSPKKFGTVGPELLWKVYNEIANRGGATSLPTILENYIFYPIKFKSHALKAFFVNKAPANLPWFHHHTVGVHFWGHLSTRFEISPNSKGGKILDKCSDLAFLSNLTASDYGPRFWPRFNQRPFDNKTRY